MDGKFSAGARSLVVLSLLGLPGCGGGYGGSSGPPPTYTVGGSISGLNGSGLRISSGGVDLTLSSPATTFTFPAQANNTAYEVTVGAQPAFPPQMCSVTNGTGTVQGANITNVAIACANVYVVLGSITGLSGTGLVIRNHGVDLPIPANQTVFTFPPQPDNTAYDVSVVTQPSNPTQTCTVARGSGTVHGSHIVDVVISCASAAAASSSAAAVEKGMSCAGPLVLTFPSSLDEATATPNAVSLTSEGVPEPITLEVRDRELTVIPADGLALSRPYALSVNRNLRDLGGERMDFPASIRCAAGDKGGERAVPIEPEVGARGPLLQVSMDSNGDALATWLENSDPSESHLWRNHYSAQKGLWSVAAPVAPDATPDTRLDSAKPGFTFIGGGQFE
jgi:hypothetical protein